MAMDALHWAYQQDVKAGPKAVLVCLAWHAAKDGWCAFPGIVTLVRETAQKERAIADHLDALEREGLIRRERRHVQRGSAKGRRMSDLFHLRPNPAKSAGDQSANSADELPANSAGDPPKTNRRFRRHQPQNPQTSPADSAIPIIRIEPSTEPSVEPRLGEIFPTDLLGEPARDKKAARGTVEKSIERDFAEFWNSFPKRVGKLTAMPAFRKAIKTGDVTAGELIESASRYSEQMAQTEIQFVKNPTVWLKGGHWMDDPAAASPASSRTGSASTRDGISSVVAAHKRAQQ